MPRRVRGVRRTPSQVTWDESASELMAKLGSAIRDARRRAGLSQSELAAHAGVVQGTISAIELGRTATVSLLVLVRVASACGDEVHAYLERASGTDEPRDIAHVRAQSLIVDLATPGGWRATPEARIDGMADRSRSIDVLLERSRPREATEVAVIEVIDWLADLGAALRDWDRRLARVEERTIATRTREGDSSTLVPRVSGCWVIRATKRNRALVSELRALFRARFTGSSRAWLAALETGSPMPVDPALLWINVKGDRIWPARP